MIKLWKYLRFVLIRGIMKYTIQTKQKNYLLGLVYDSIDEVIESIVFYDLLPPFKVFDELKKDVTDIIISKLSKMGYKFIDKKKVATKIPLNLQNLMNKYYKNTVILKDKENTSIKLVTVKDIKSIMGFYDLWENNAITIGISGLMVLVYDCFSKNICTISLDSMKDFSKKKVILGSVDEFIKSYYENIN